jgi:hypothetical protein
LEPLPAPDTEDEDASEGLGRLGDDNADAADAVEYESGVHRTPDVGVYGVLPAKPASLA